MGNYIFFIQRSVSTGEFEFSEEDSEQSESDSVEPEEIKENIDLEKGIFFEPYIPVDDEEEENKSKISPARRKWMCCTWCLTWWMPVYI